MEVKRGLHRTVLLVGNYAIKVPRLKGYKGRAAVVSVARAVSANDSERQWSGVEGVCPVKFSVLSLVNVYPRAEPWSHEHDPPYDEIGEGWIPRDRKPENIGYIYADGAYRPVWLDYDGSWNGCPHSRNAAGLTMDDDD